jgi:hypothetical protein
MRKSCPFCTVSVRLPNRGGQLRNMELTIAPHGAGGDGPDDAAARIHYAEPLTRRPLKRSEEAARLIVREIMDRQLQPGELVASETAMLESYQVSRESLREALRLLETQGLVELRRGRGGGALVGAVAASNLGRLGTLYYQLEGGTYDDLLEAWVFAESALAEAAACNPGLKARRAAMDAFTRSSCGKADCHRAPVFEELAFLLAIAGQGIARTEGKQGRATEELAVIGRLHCPQALWYRALRRLQIPVSQ